MKGVCLSAMMLVCCSFAMADNGEFDTWPPRQYLIDSLVEGVPSILNSYHPETGRFGTEPWICGDQNVIFPLAVAWSLEDPSNPFYHSDEVLAAIAGGGEALVDAQDEAGRWRFDKKDGSYWGQIHMPWTYSRWIRAYQLVRDALPEAARAKWERGLLLGYGQIYTMLETAGTHNIPTHHAMGLRVAGEVFDNEAWRERAREFMAKVVARQDPVGFWSEHSGPVIGYNFVYVEALGIYYAHAQDPVVLEALRRSANFHASVLWPNGSSVAAIDERQIYGGGVALGNVGFSFTPEGRGFLVSQLAVYNTPQRRLVGADYAASMLTEAGTGEVVLPGAIGEDGVVILGDADALIRRGQPWSWCLSAYTAEVSDSRWIQDRQNLVDIFHSELGMIAGGGNTKLQPYWSTFTVGDPTLLAHTPGDESPDFTPDDIDLQWTPTQAEASREGDVTRLDVSFAPRVPTRREELLAQGFEEVTAGELPGEWSVDFGAARQMGVTADRAHSGGQALWLADHDDAQSLGLRSPKVAAEPGGEYFVEAWWLGAPENNAAVYLEFWSEQGRIEDAVRSFYCSGTGEWVKAGGAARAPEGTVAATVLVYSGSTTVAEGYFDDVVLGRRVTDEPAGDPVACSVEVRPDGERVVLIYRAEAGRRVEAHLPLMRRAPRLTLAGGEVIRLAEEPVELSAEQIGGFFTYADVKVTVQPPAGLRWPARQHNPYTKDGSSSLGAAKLVLVMPFEDTDEYTVTLERSTLAFEGTVLEARDLPVTLAEGCYTKRLDSLGSQLLGASKVGDWITFALPPIEPGPYELLVDWVLADVYGINQVEVDGQPVGEPFDAYYPDVDGSGCLVRAGEVELGPGEHSITIRVVGKNEQATDTIISVRRFLLRPLD
ncbi:MAG: hypothetical protein AB7Y46_03475 [Armatimonadota bacterium]